MNQSQKQWLRAKAAFEAVMLRSGGVKVEDNHFEKYHVATTCGTLAVSLSDGLGFVAAKFLTDPTKTAGYKDLPTGDGLNTFSWKWNCHAFKGQKADILAAIEIFEGRLKKILPQVETMKTTKAQFTPKCECGCSVCNGKMTFNGVRFVCEEGQSTLEEHSSRWPVYEAAPDLLKACKALLRLHYDEGKPSAEGLEAVHLAEAAIRKARGGA